MEKSKGRGVEVAKQAGFDISDFARHPPYSAATEALRENGFGIYRAIANGREIGYVQYRKIEDEKLLIVCGTYTDPRWRHRKVATTLIESMHGDYPDYYVDVGANHARDLPTGPGFYDYLKGVLPDFLTTVIQEGARDSENTPKPKR